MKLAVRARHVLFAGALPGLPGTGDCPSEPVKFRNIDANPTDLNAGRSYEALPFQ